MAVIFWLVGILVGASLFAWGAGAGSALLAAAGVLITVLSMVYGVKGRSSYTRGPEH